MRSLLSSLLLVAACTVPDKQPATGDGGTDAPVDPDAAPETTITLSPGEFSNAGTATFEFESNNPDARFTCSLDGEPAAACTSPFVRTLADGPHSFSVRAINANGLADNTPAEHLWSIDTVAPITTLTEAPPAADNSTDVRFSFISNEMFASFECSLDGGAFAECRSGDTFGPVGDGAHSFSVRARDRAGNVDASPAVHAWQVDTSTPDTTIVSGPEGQVASSSATFTFLSPDAGPGATFECSLDGSAFAACTSPVTYNNLAMGVHTFSVRVRDANGNFDPTPATRTWTADITPPETSITDAPTGVVAMASASISFTANEATVTYACSLDGAPLTPCTSPFNVTGLAQGAHAFAVVATDMAGNADPTPATASWTVDTVTPEVTFTGGPAAGETVGPLVAFAFSVSEGSPECRVDGGAWMACTTSFSYNHPAGASTFEVRIVDGAGNETIAMRSFTVACDAPAPTGAAGLLHLEDGGQTLANDAGGAAAVLGTTTDPEAVDPAFAAARFGMGLSFTAGDGDVVTWPLMLGTQQELSIELWVNPGALSGTRDIAVSGDGRLGLHVEQATSSTVRFVVTSVDGQGVTTRAASSPYPANAWHLVAVSLSPIAAGVIVDGDVFMQQVSRNDVTVDTLRIGGTFGGVLDEIWVATAGYADALARYCPTTAIRYN